LASALESEGLKQAEIGALLGLSQSAISRRKKRAEEIDSRLEDVQHG
jgi:predicted transcriptional regulator